MAYYADKPCNHMQRAPVFTENVTQNVPSILTARLQSAAWQASGRVQDCHRMLFPW